MSELRRATLEVTVTGVRPMHSPSPPPVADVERRSGGFISVGLVLSLVGAMVATLLGAGAFVDAFTVQDGNAWLWSEGPGSASRVNANSGRVDMRQPLIDSRGHRVRVTQNDKYLMLHDLETGQVNSVDLTRMIIAGRLDVGTTSDVSVVLHGDTAAIVDRTKGLVRGIDPVTLHASSQLLRLPPPLVGGAFDTSGRLWLAVPSQGTVVAARVSADGVAIDRTEVVANPDGDLVLTVLDHGALAVQRDAGRLAVVDAQGVIQVQVPGTLSNAEVPARTVGQLVAITSPADRSMVVFRLGDSTPTRFPLPKGVEPGTAVPYQDRIYVPDERAAVVRVFTPAGEPLAPVRLDGARGDLELEVREGRLFINSPETSVARVVDEDGVSQEVNKYREDVAGGEGLNGRVLPAPHPGDNQGDGEEKQGPPGSPAPVTAVAGDSLVRLAWGAAAPNGAPIEGYEITWDGDSRQVSGETQRIVIDGLRNGTTYRFQVVAHNRFGAGPPAQSELVTPTDRIPSKPENVRAAVAPDEGGVRVRWDPVPGARTYVVTPLQNGSPAQGVAEVTESDEEAVVLGLRYGEPYRFQVAARNDSGAGSDPSDPSNEVTPYAAPDPPRNPSAQSTSAGQVTVQWEPGADNGDPITEYVVRPSVGNQVSVAGNAREAVVGGLPTGETVSFQIVARNRAGAGQPATTSARVGRDPTVSIQGTSGGYNSITVNFTVNDYGMQASCNARVDGGNPVGGSCSRLTINGLYPGRDYTVVVTASNQIGGTGEDREMTSTAVLMGTVTCKNDLGSSDPDRRTYCDNGVSMYWSPSQSASKAGRAYDGNRKQAVCKREDPFPPGDERAIETAYVYNNYKSSRWWIKMPDDRWIPHIWLNLDAGDGDTTSLAILPAC